jgi:glucose-6-phosphate 1-epimerase
MARTDESQIFQPQKKLKKLFDNVSHHNITTNKRTMMKLSFCLLAASAITVAGFGVAPVAFTSKALSRTSVILEASRNAQKIASRSAWAESRLAGGADPVAEEATAGIMTNDDGLEYVKLVHPSGASSEVYLFGGDVTSYKDKDGIEYIAVRPDAKMDGSKPISGGLSHCFPQVGLCFAHQTRC